MPTPERIEVVPTDHFPSVSVVGVRLEGPETWDFVEPGDQRRAGGRPWSRLLRSTLADLTPSVGRSRAVATGTTTFGPASFLRMTEVSGDRLTVTLSQWWRLNARDEELLRFTTAQQVGGGWLLTGTFRTAVASRPIPVDVSLWPHLGRWTRLELTPRRRVHPDRRYFREGNSALDRLVAAIRAQDVLVETYQGAAREHRA